MKTGLQDIQDRTRYFELGISIPAFFLLLLVFQLFFMPGLLRQGGHLYVPYKKIIVGGSPDNPPYEYLDENNEPAGYNVDLTRAVAAEMKIDVEIKLADQATINKEFQEGNIDLLQGITRSFATSPGPPFFSHTAYSQKVFAAADYPEFVTSLQQLRGGRVCLSQKTPFLEQLIRANNALEFSTVATHAEALRQLAEGKADYALIVNLPGLYLERELNFLKQGKPDSTIVEIGELNPPLGYGYLAREDNSDILELINKSLTNLQLSGRQKEIQEQWLGKFDNQVISRREKSVQLGGLIFSPLLLTVCAVLFWSHSLKREVDRRSRELAIQNRQLLQADKMTSLGILVAGVAHEINNPTGLILHNLSTLKRIYETADSILEERYQQEGDFFIGGIPYSMLREESPRIFSEMEDGANRITQIINDLKDFSRKDSKSLSEPASLNDIVTTSIRLLESSFKKQNTLVKLDLAMNLPKFMGNSPRIQQVVINLLLNASQAGAGDKVELSVMTLLSKKDNELIFCVEDDGIGIEKEKLDFLTDPFYTTKRETGGTGLGLFISQRIVDEHGGRLVYDSEPGKGTAVYMYLPLPENS